MILLRITDEHDQNTPFHVWLKKGDVEVNGVDE
jgi:hypothetical protein